MGIEIEKSNGGETVRISKDIISDSMKEILDEKHECMRKFCLDHHSKVIFDRSINQKNMSQEKKALIEELNDYLVNHCEKVATLLESEEEKTKYNYKFRKKRKLVKIKGFINNEIERAKNFLE